MKTLNFTVRRRRPNTVFFRDAKSIPKLQRFSGKSDIFEKLKRIRLTWLIIFLVIGLSGIYFLNPAHQMLDFTVYYYAGKSLLSGRTDLYAPNFALSPLLDYRYPPLFVIIISPLALFPQTIATYIWYWLCILETAGCVYFIQQMIAVTKTGPDADTAAASNRFIWTFTFLIACGYFLIALKYGNAHILLTFLMCGSFYFLMRRKEGRAALMMSLAITLKIIPVIGLPFFAVKRQWKFLILTIVLTILLNLAPSFYFGFNQNAELIGTWYRHVIVDQETHEKNSWLSISLKGELLRYLTETDYSKKDAGADTDYQSINIASISETASNRIWLAGSLAIYTFCLFLFWSVPANSQIDAEATNAGPPFRRTLIEYSLIICLTLFIEPLSPKLYLFMLLLPAAFLVSIVFSPAHRSDKINRCALLLIAAANVILPLIPGRMTQRLFLVVGTDFYILGILIAVCIRLLLSENRTGRFLNTSGNFPKLLSGNEPAGIKLKQPHNS